MYVCMYVQTKSKRWNGFACDLFVCVLFYIGSVVLSVNLCVHVLLYMFMCACLYQCIPESVKDFTRTGANAKCLEHKI